MNPPVCGNINPTTSALPASVPVQQADVWSCGVMLYTMVTGRYPFQRPEDQQWQPGLQLHHMLQVGHQCVVAWRVLLSSDE